MNKNPYEVLGVARDANDADIKKAYHKLVMQYHPDKNPDDKAAEEKFKEVNNAFDILKDPQKRAAYDQFGSAAFGNGNGASAGGFGGGNPFEGFEFNFGGGNGFTGMSDIIDEALKNFGFGGAGARGSARARPAEMRGRDLLHETTITLKDAYHGKTEKVKFSTNIKCEKCDGHGTADGKPAPTCEHCSGSGFVRVRRGLFITESACPECHGTGRTIKNPCSDCDGAGVLYRQQTVDVTIPAGIMDGTRIQIKGKGEAAPLGGTPGDLYVDVHIKDDAVFERDGNNLVMQVIVPFSVLALGGEITVSDIDGNEIPLKISAGTQINESLKIRGKGMPSRGGHHGDLFVVMKTEVPKRLSEKQKKALAEYAGVEKGKKGWF